MWSQSARAGRLIRHHAPKSGATMTSASELSRTSLLALALSEPLQALDVAKAVLAGRRPPHKAVARTRWSPLSSVIADTWPRRWQPRTRRCDALAVKAMRTEWQMSWPRWRRR